MTKRSAGLLMFRRREQGIEVFLVHPGGPFWAKKDLGAWSIPKGEIAENEDGMEAAKREFAEETGMQPEGIFFALGEVRQAGGKVVTAWAMEGDFDPSTLVANTCAIEWPPRSGQKMKVPEVDRGEWFLLETAREKILKGQGVLLDMLLRIVN
ncbi:NUDIX domain-containing protein [Acidipila sp. 4G-K13]|uniref:NUDIX domain-containing protein n=2 Tax=Paracidobacterium acidisoli TaxID=2303751 RepID=A0A372IU13_9BACT|nr:NUDIX domain-containing protein [Paracidobacterium acidisoli]